MRLSRTTLAGFAVALVALAGCGARKDPVLALVDDLEAAAEDKSADGIRDRLADGFRGQDRQNRAETYATLRRYFAAYETIELEVYDVSVQRSDGAADVRFRVLFSGHARSIGGLDGFLPPGAAYRFDLHVIDQGGTWKVDRAAWETDAPPPAEP
jgi:hypothetical protein